MRSALGNTAALFSSLHRSQQMHQSRREMNPTQSKLSEGKLASQTQLGFVLASNWLRMWSETFYSQSVRALLSGKNRGYDLKHVKEFPRVLQFWGKRHIVPLLRIHYLFIIFLPCVFFAIWSCCALLSQSTKISRMTFSSTERRNRRDCFLRVIMPKRTRQKKVSN